MDSHFETNKAAFLRIFKKKKKKEQKNVNKRVNELASDK